MPSRRVRALVAILLGLVAASLTVAVWALTRSDWRVDMDPSWMGAMALRHGDDPYLRSWALTFAGWPWPLAYPMPAVLLFLPLTGVSLWSARFAFVAGSTALLAYGLTRRGWWPLVLLLSGAYWQACIAGQWSPLLTGAMLVPAASPLLACKPNLGLVCWLGTDRKRLAFWAAFLTLAASVALYPSWPAAYVVALPTLHTTRPLVLRPGGVLLLLAALRWREPAARMLLVYALLPTSGSPYDALPLLAILTTTPRRALGLSVASLAGFAWWAAQPAVGVSATVAVAHAWPVTLATAYLPALVLVLRPGARSA